jgi:hypothetical protein
LNSLNVGFSSNIVESNGVGDVIYLTSVSGVLNRDGFDQSLDGTIRTWLWFATNE